MSTLVRHQLGELYMGCAIYCAGPTWTGQTGIYLSIDTNLSCFVGNTIDHFNASDCCQ